MWISDPTPVTTRIITADSGSTLNATSRLNTSDEIHVYSVCSIARLSGAMPASCQTTIAETTNDAIIASEASQPDTLFGSRLPTNALITNPTSGNSGMSASIT